MTTDTTITSQHMRKLCIEIDNRCVGSSGNLKSTEYFEYELVKSGWHIKRHEFKAFDWEAEDALLQIDNTSFNLQVSPYSLCCDVKDELVFASTMDELKKTDTSDKILCLSDQLTKESLMPKSFVFYNPEHHKQMVKIMEDSKAKAILFIINKNGVHEGGEYPFPIVEDRDFNIPSAYIEEEKGTDLFRFEGKQARLIFNAIRTPSKGFNIIGIKGNSPKNRIVITAHIDTKKNTPGAIDNATGVTTLLLLAHLLKDYSGSYQVELVALNGEDYYSIPGQMTYIEKNQGKFKDIKLNINIDGIGLKEGMTSFSFFNLPSAFETAAKGITRVNKGIIEGVPWVQGDHSIFLQFGVPAIAISSKWLLDNLETQKITHTPEDNIDIVDFRKVNETAEAIFEIITKISS